MSQNHAIPLLYIALTCVIFYKINSFSLPMIPIHSPELQILPQNVNKQQHLELLKNITLSRASLYSTQSRKNSSSRVNSIESNLYQMLSNYFVTQIFFGTSSDMLSAYVLLDTGSVNTWVQCDGCNPCFELKGGNIKIQKSISHKLLSKDDPRCNPYAVISNRWCGYRNVYGGRAVSIGTMGTDNFLFLNSETKRPDIFPDVAFGCGLQNTNVVFGLNVGPDNMIAGVFGMSLGPQSILNQLDSTIKGRFSYCLTSWAEPEQGISTVHFGDSAQISGRGLQQINMNSEGRYHLYFRGISVDGYRLPNVDSTICPLDEGRTKGFIIDSGAPFLSLPEMAYQPLSDVVTTFFAKYGWQHIQEKDLFDHCFTSGSSGLNYDNSPFPEVVFYFSRGDGSGEEVDWVMKKENMFVRFSPQKFCMVVVKSPIVKFCLFGAYQQADFKVLYDVKNSKLFFMPQKCQENT